MKIFRASIIALAVLSVAAQVWHNLEDRWQRQAVERINTRAVHEVDSLTRWGAEGWYMADVWRTVSDRKIDSAATDKCGKARADAVRYRKAQADRRKH